MSAKPNTKRLHEDIKKEFDKLMNVQAHGVQKYSLDYILREVGHKYYRSHKTIENIVFNRTATTQITSVQGELFTQ